MPPLKKVKRDLILKEVTLLQDNDATVRVRAAKALGFEAYIEYYSSRKSEELPEELPTVRDALLSSLRNDPDAAVRSHAAWDLGYLQPAVPEVLAALLSSLRNDPDAAVRSSVAWSLGPLGADSPEVLAALLSALQTDGDSDVRAGAACSLAQRGMVSHEMLTALIEGLRVSRHWYVRDSAAEMLGKFGQGDEPTIQALLQGLRDSDGYVRLACVQALVQIGQRFPTGAALIESKLVQAIADQEFESVGTTEMPDDSFVARRPAYDYAYDALWLLVASRKAGEVEGRGS